LFDKTEWKTEWNYCLVITDSCTRFSFAFPLRNLTVCSSWCKFGY